MAMDIAVKFDLRKMTGKDLTQDIFTGLDLNRINGALIFSGDSDKTLEGLDNIYYNGFICQSKEQLDYLKECLNRVVEQVDAAVEVVTGVYKVEPLCVWGKVRDGRVYELAEDGEVEVRF